MAYTRHYSRRYRRRRHVFGKKAEAAIKAIAQKPVETKKFWRQVPSYFGAGTNADYGRIFNVFANVPKDLAGPDSEEAVIGNKFMARGVKFVLSTVTSADFETITRATVFSATDYYKESAGIVISASDPWYEQDVSAFLPRKRYNSQVVNVLHSVTWRNAKQYSTQGADEAFHTFWVPIKGQKTSEAEEEADFEVNKLKGRNYYLVLEHMVVGAGATPPWTTFGISASWCVYFKDA